LSELLGTVEGKPVQDELSAVRVLFELFGFLLNCRCCLMSEGQLDSRGFLLPGSANREPVFLILIAPDTSASLRLQ
jgi:hypothetical protein